MKLKSLVAFATAVALVVAGCGSPKYIETSSPKVYPTVGLLSNKSPEVCYGVSVGNVIWSIVLIETIIAPIYFLGFSIQNPERKKTGPGDECD